MNSQKPEIAFSNRYLYYYASLIRKLYGFIIRRGGNQPDERYVGHIGEQPQRKKQADEHEEFVHWLQDDQDTERQSLTKHQQTWFEAIKQYALWGQEAERSKEARNILADVGPQTKNYKRLAFECLVAKGVWQLDEILDLHRSEIPTTFSTSEREEAKVSFSPQNIKGRKHFQRGLFVIQDADLPEIAISYRKPLLRGPEFGVHIPDLSAIIAPASKCDLAAADRLQTISLPGQTLSLLPETLSFLPDTPIPTLSLIWRMDRKGRLKSFAITPSVSTIQNKLTADELDRAQSNSAHIHHRAITFFHQLANRLQERRTQRDPDFDIPDLRVVAQNQKSHIEPISNQLAHHIFNELRTLSGVAIGRWCTEHNLPAIYETRDEIEDIETRKQIEHPIVRRHEIRRITPTIKKSEQPAYHHALGVSVYCPITDPNNHYAHLMMQRQINHHLQHNNTYYTDEQLNTMRFQIQEMHAIANGIVFRRQRDLLLELWEVGQNFEATVLHMKRHGVLAELKNAPLKTIVYPGHIVQVGDEITLRFTGINTERSQAHFTVLQPTTLTRL
jgi:exoribonuclease R